MRAHERLLRYVAIDTNSDDLSGTHPSSPNQMTFAAQLTEEMKGMGISDARMDEHGYVYGSIPAKGCGNQPAIGLIAHMDTASSVPGGPVKPRIVYNYDGGDIPLSDSLAMTVSENEFLPELVGQDIIVTDGNTLLGADDKAGIAEIMTLCERLLAADAPEHGKICIAFTPDEEIGEGADFFDVPGFGAEYAYTVDGGALGEVEWETFNAASGTVLFHGVNIHPGSAKNKMRNASLMALAFAGMLPPEKTPAHTEGYEGFYHLCGMQGNEEEASLGYIIRNHDRAAFESMKERFTAIGEYLEGVYGKGTVEVCVKDSYYNMAEVLKEHKHVVQRAIDAMEACGVKPLVQPIRGGTDGSRLSFMGLPCPNLSTGGYNFHSRRECIPVQAMDRMVEVLEALITAR